MTVPSTPKALARSEPWNICWISPEVCGATMPAAVPWISRNTTSQPVLGANPHAAEATVNTASPKRKAWRRPRMSPSRPAGTSASPKVRAYPETTHAWVASEAPSPRSSEGSATLTIEVSRSEMKPAARQTPSAFHRRSSGAVRACSVLMGSRYAVMAARARRERPCGTPERRLPRLRFRPRPTQFRRRTTPFAPYAPRPRRPHAPVVLRPPRRPRSSPRGRPAPPCSERAPPPTPRSLPGRGRTRCRAG